MPDGTAAPREMRTEDASYAERLLRNERVWWKRLLDVQRPYRAHLRRLELGFVLEVGCGVGRNLLALGSGGAVGVDHNEQAVEIARGRGGVAFTPAEFRASGYASSARFDALLVAHVLEHLDLEGAAALLDEYVAFVRPSGRVVIITPQEAGFRSDPTHVELMDFGRVRAVLERARIAPVSQYSFPFPRLLGRAFKYNEFVTIGRVASS
jgi:SAM-dependent methyltransferase